MLKCFNAIRSCVRANVHTNVNTMKKSDLAQMKSVACEAIDNATVSTLTRRAKLGQIQGGLQRAIQDSPNNCNNFLFFTR